MADSAVYIGRVRTARVVRGTVSIKGGITAIPPTPGDNPLIWGDGNPLTWGAGNTVTWG